MICGMWWYMHWKELFKFIVILCCSRCATFHPPPKKKRFHSPTLLSQSPTSTGPVFHPDFFNFHFRFRKLISNSLCWYPTVHDYNRLLPSSGTIPKLCKPLNGLPSIGDFFCNACTSSVLSHQLHLKGLNYRMTQFQDVPSEWNLLTFQLWWFQPGLGSQSPEVNCEWPGWSPSTSKKPTHSQARADSLMIPTLNRGSNPMTRTVIR